MKTVACRCDLGMTRIAGYMLFDSKSLEFNETTPRDVERLVRKKQVNGLVFDSEGALVPDLEGWNLGNIRIKTSMGNFRNWNTSDPRGDTVYSVVRAITIDGIGTIYETINNRCARVFYTGKQLAVLSGMAWVGGIKVNEDDDSIELCKGVQVEDWSDRAVYELGNQVLTREQLQEQTMKELFGQEATVVTGATAETEIPGAPEEAAQEEVVVPEPEEPQASEVPGAASQQVNDAEVSEGAGEVQSIEGAEGQPQLEAEGQQIEGEGQQEFIEHNSPEEVEHQEGQNEPEVPVEQPQGEQPQGEQPQGEQSQAEQAEGEQPQGEQPQGQQPEGGEPEHLEEDSQENEPKQGAKSSSHRSHKKKR